MSETIKDGTGSCYTVAVDKNNRLHTHSVNESLSQNASRIGDAYNINTGNISLTTDTTSEVLYLENVGDNDLHIATIGYLLGNSTGGSGDVEMMVSKNITGGTLISGALTPTINENKNVGSKKTLNVNVYKGVEGATSTGGVPFYSSLIGSAPRSYPISTGDIIISRGGNISLSITPPTGNTSMNVQVFLAIIEYTID